MPPVSDIGTPESPVTKLLALGGEHENAVGKGMGKWASCTPTKSLLDPLCIGNGQEMTFLAFMGSCSLNSFGLRG